MRLRGVGFGGEGARRRGERQDEEEVRRSVLARAQFSASLSDPRAPVLRAAIYAAYLDLRSALLLTAAYDLPSIYIRRTDIYIYI